jgi:5-methylcytosine-specific restriction protein A
MVLRRDPVCQDPYDTHNKNNETAASTEVDHIIPLRQGGKNTMDNLQGLCKSCHSRKTALEDGGFGEG